MSGVDDRDRAAGKPFLIRKAEDGSFRLALRETRYNSQNYPIVTDTPVGESFKSAAAARAYAKEHYGAAAGEFTMK
jgi:hypothetical protein